MDGGALQEMEGASPGGHDESGMSPDGGAHHQMEHDEGHGE